jgi:hypothetical protein
MKRLLFALSLTVLVSGAAFADGGKRHACCGKTTAASSCCKDKSEKTAKAPKVDRKADKKKA